MRVIGEEVCDQLVDATRVAGLAGGMHRNREGLEGGRSAITQSVITDESRRQEEGFGREKGLGRLRINRLERGQGWALAGYDAMRCAVAVSVAVAGLGGSMVAFAAPCFAAPSGNPYPPD
jgi:hypothetical protein